MIKTARKKWRMKDTETKHNETNTKAKEVWSKKKETNQTFY